MLNRYSIVFYFSGLAFLLLEKDIIALILLTICGFFIGYLHSSMQEYEDLDTPLSFQDILLFKNKEELLKAIKGGLPEVEEEKPKRKIDVKNSLIFISIFASCILFLAFINKNPYYLFSLFSSPFLISFQEEKND